MMSKFAVVALVATSVFAQQKHPVREEIVEEIRAKARSWTPKAVEKNHLRDIPADVIHMKLGMMGTAQSNPVLDASSSIIVDTMAFFMDLIPQAKKYLGMKDHKRLKQNEEEVEIPDRFDAREKWPECIHDIRDQQLCGSCWAFASSGFLSDRFCIHSGGEINEVLAPQDLVACNFENYGCNGGQLVPTIDYLMTEGIVSEKCMPYQNGDSFCEFKCINQKEQYTKYFCKPHSMKILSDPKHIQIELMTNGPMMVGMTVYADFMSYEKGVYSYTTGEAVGGHAIKILGWGHDEVTGDLFWICQNQWGKDWGESGFVNIKAGQLGLDSMVLGCMPDII